MIKNCLHTWILFTVQEITGFMAEAGIIPSDEQMS